MTSPSSKTYTKFLSLVQAIRELPSFPQLDPVEERLLNQLAAAWEAGEDVTVLEAMNMSPDASARTVHRRLKTLREKGMLQLKEHKTDSRIRYIVPGAAARKYFEKLGRALLQAARA